MLGDVILAEPGALIGFGPRVLKKQWVNHFQKGFKDQISFGKGFCHIVDRKNMKAKLTLLINLLHD